ncbi:MAG TPA: pitrilysin family protein [Gemmatimonadaceae bacterium]|nr:pitrilysin family protein [Gemmatimonadaceae bacterium]
MTAGATLPSVPRPEPGPPRPYRFPTFARDRLANGIELIVAPVHKLPMVTMMVIADAGAMAEPAGRAGVAALTARALLEGTRRRSAMELTERLELLGAATEAYADWDSAALSMTVLSTRLDQAFELFGEVLLEPAFPEREVERLKAERLAELLQLRTEPRGLADEMFSRFLYDPSSRYALPEGGNSETVTALSAEAAREFYQARYRPEGLTLVVVGNVTTATARSLADRVLGDWRAAPPAEAVVLDGAARATRAIHIVRKEDAPQSELRVGHVGLPRHHPDYFSVLVMNSVLGGLFSSRINLNLRERHGYTYGAFSSYEWRRGAGPFVVSSAVQSGVTDAAAREVLAEIDRIREAEIAEDELTLATSYLAGVFPIRYETTTAIARALAALVVYRLPADYFDRYRERVSAISTADVLHAAQKHLHPEQLQLVVVGDPSVRDTLESLGFGELVVYNAEGRESVSA